MRRGVKVRAQQPGGEGRRASARTPTLVAFVVVAAITVAALVQLLATPPPRRLIAAYFTSLDGRTGSQRHNAHLALEQLNGTVLAPGAEFSFNQVVGSLSRDQGFRRAPVSYNGTLIDDWGGGVCQTSTTLYNAAMLAGLELVERHPHRFAPSYVPAGRDAAVAFSSVDLRFRNPFPFAVRLSGRIDGDRLLIEVWGKKMPKGRPQIVQEVHGVQTPGTLVLEGPSPRVRNTGKAGSEVATYRVTGDRRELLSLDSYPVMDRVVERRDRL
ncbi:MAG: VanW family protein [Fimbriimonadaceae bacterium]|nr:VanW family protein [Chthonomonadaceae bacterium]MCO5295983.1 VanW family protein [Fimbriimonadaceae bacterium]